MNPNDRDDAWGDLGDLWRAQPVSAPDLERLRREAAAGQRRARRLTVFELVMLAIATGTTVPFLLARPGLSTVDVVVLGLLAVGAVFTAWTVRNRRAPRIDATLAPEALIAVEIARAQASIRFWRVNAAVIVIVWLALCLLAGADAAGWIDTTARYSTWLAPLINLPLVAGSLWWGRRRERPLRARIEALEAMRASTG